MTSFGNQPAGTVDSAEIAAALNLAFERVDELRGELGLIKQQAKWIKGAGLVELDISRTLVALGAACLALDRGRRHAEMT